MTEQGLLAQLKAVKGEDINSSHACAVSKWLKTLTAKERAEYEAIIDDTQYTATSISRVLQKNGIKINAVQLRYHRNRKDMRGCNCK